METGYERIAELVVKLQGGDNSAFNELYKLTSGRAYFVAFEITKNEQDAEDILQESYIKMLEKINTLDKPESFVSWFHHMVANKSKDSLKKKKPSLLRRVRKRRLRLSLTRIPHSIPRKTLIRMSCTPLSWRLSVS